MKIIRQRGQAVPESTSVCRNISYFTSIHSAMDSSGDAVDVIGDFQMGDRIDLSRIGTITGLGDIMQEVSDGNLVLTAGDFKLMLEGVGQMLEASDFIFG